MYCLVWFSGWWDDWSTFFKDANERAANVNEEHSKQFMGDIFWSQFEEIRHTLLLFSETWRYK